MEASSSAPARLVCSHQANISNEGTPAAGRMPQPANVLSLIGRPQGSASISSLLARRAEFVFPQSTRSPLSRSGLIGILDTAIRMMDDDDTPLAPADQLNWQTSANYSSSPRSDSSPPEQ